jgi:hypothetical protein
MQRGEWGEERRFRGLIWPASSYFAHTQTKTGQMVDPRGGGQKLKTVNTNIYKVHLKAQMLCWTTPCIEIYLSPTTHF